MCALLYERGPVEDSEENIPPIPVPHIVEKEEIADRPIIVPQQESAETAVTIRSPEKHVIKANSQNISLPISYSLLSQEHEINFTMLPGLTSFKLPPGIDLSTLIEEINLENNCFNHNSIVSRPCAPSLAIEPESTRLISIESDKNSNAYQIDCGSHLEEFNRHDESTGLKEQCLGGINIGGKNWNLEFWGAMTYRIDPNEKKFDITPCPDGELTECTTIGIGLKIDIP